MTDGLRENLFFYLKHLYPVDFLFALLVAFIFICVLLFVAFLRNSPIIATLLILFNFIFCSCLAVYGYQFIDTKVRQRAVNIVNENFYGSSNFALDFSISNDSKYNFKYCKVKAKIYDQADANASFITRLKNEYIPIRIKSKTINELLKGQSKDQRINFENLSPESNFSVKLQSECF